MWVWELNPVPLKERPVILKAEPSPQPLEAASLAKHLNMAQIPVVLSSPRGNHSPRAEASGTHLPVPPAFWEFLFLGK